MGKSEPGVFARCVRSVGGQLLPRWVVAYRRQQLAADVFGGLLVAILVIPQSLAYALLAGLPPQAGLYASILPVIVYALVGSSMTQAVGPVAITALMTGSVLSPLAPPGSTEYLGLAAGLSLLSGVMIAACGFLRLGFLAQLLSRPVVSGFISGSALLIVLSQLKILLGVGVGAAASGNGADYAWHLVEPLHPATAALGLTALLLLYTARRWLASLLVRFGLAAAAAALVVRLAPLLVVFSAMLSVVALDLDRTHGVAVVGRVGDGLASFGGFVPSLAMLRSLAVPAVVLSLIGMVQNITMAQALAVKRRERVDANRELIGLGLANVAAAYSGGMPVGGGLSRSAVNVAAGSQTPLASLVAALVMLIVVASGTHWLARLPLAALAASIVVAALGMIDYRSLRQAWSYDRADALALIGTALGVVIVGIEQGIAIGIGLSLATLLLRASTPHIAVIGRLRGSEHFRNVERHGVETLSGVLLLRIDESLFFGNLSAVEARLAGELDKAPATHDVVLVMSGVNRVDTTAMEVLSDINRDLGERAIRLHLAEVKGPVQDRLQSTPLWSALAGRVHLSVNSAFERLAVGAQSPRANDPDQRS